MLRLAFPFVLAPLFPALAGCGTQASVAGECPAVLPGWATPFIGQPVHSVNVTIGLRGRQIFWNGVPVDQSTMVNHLSQSRQMRPLALIIFDSRGAADCAFAEQVRDQIDRAYQCQSAPMSCAQGSREQMLNAPSIQHDGAPPA